MADKEKGNRVKKSGRAPKLLALITVCALMAACIAGCAPKEAEPGQTPETTQPEARAESEPAAGPEQAAQEIGEENWPASLDPEPNWEAVYDTVMNKAPYEHIRRFFGGAEEYGYKWVYAYHDIDGNDVPELLIALDARETEMVGLTDNRGVFIKQIWTVENNTGILLIEDYGEGDAEGVYIGYYGVVGTQQFSDVGVYEFYRIEDGNHLERICSAGWLLSENPATNIWEPEYYQEQRVVPLSHSSTKISELDFEGILNEYGSDPDAASYAEWRPLPSNGPEGSFRPEFPAVAASSEKAGVGSVTYHAGHVCDDDYNTAWCEGVAGPGVGEWIELSSADAQTVHGFSIINGYTKWGQSGSLYYMNNAVKKVTVIADDFSQTFTLRWGRSPQSVIFEAPIQTKSMRFRIDEVYFATDSGLSDVDDEDTLIGRIEVF